MEKGLTHVYTGDAKGKTTAAFGLALRALGRGMRVLVVQFLKGGPDPSGELVAISRIPGAEVIRFEDQRHPIFCPECDVKALRKSINDGLSLARKETMSGGYDLIVLDEVNNCMSGGWLAPSLVGSLINEKPDSVELVLTGRGCPDDIIALADYVTEMRLVKHPAQVGIMGRLGVEF